MSELAVNKETSQFCCGDIRHHNKEKQMQNSIIEKAKKTGPIFLNKVKKNNAGPSKIVFYQKENIDCTFENGRLKSTGTKQNLYYRVDTVINNKKGISFGNNLDDLETITDKAVSLAKIGSVSHFSCYPKPAPIHKVKTYSDKTVSLSRENIIETCRKYSEKLKNYNPELFITSGAEKSESEKLIITNAGVCEEIKSTSWAVSGYVQQTDDNGILFAGYYRIWRELNDYYDVDFLCEQTIQQLEYSKTYAESKQGKTISFLTPRILKMILRGFFMGINGRNIAKGDSPLKGRIGDELFSKNLTITDNPHIDFSSGACSISNEGIPSKVTPLIKNGVLKNFLYDLDSAAIDNTEATGHNACSPYNIVITPGEKTSSRLISEIDEGIYINDLIGFGQSNIINGDFSCSLGLGFKIKNGKITGRLKNVMISGNIYDIFKNNVILSSNTEPTISVPFAVVEGINVS